MIELSYFTLGHFFQGVKLKMLHHFMDSEIDHIRHSIKICKQGNQIQLDFSESTARVYQIKENEVE